VKRGSKVEADRTLSPEIISLFAADRSAGKLFVPTTYLVRGGVRKGESFVVGQTKIAFKAGKGTIQKPLRVYLIELY